MKKFTTALTVIALFLSFYFGGIYSKNPHLDAYDSTCYIQLDSKEIDEQTQKPNMMCGTGIVIGETNSDYLILTAGHICDQALDGKVYLNFPTSKIKATGQIIYCDLCHPDELKRYAFPGEDIAVISVPKSVGRLLTQPIDLSRPNDVFTIGCSRGEYPSVVLTKVTCLVPGGFYMDFHPAPGRSGSGVFSSKGVVGIVLTQGGCCLNAEKIKKVLDCVAPPVDKFHFLTIIGEDFHQWLNRNVLDRVFWERTTDAPPLTEEEISGH